MVTFAAWRHTAQVCRVAADVVCVRHLPAVRESAAPGTQPGL